MSEQRRRMVLIGVAALGLVALFLIARRGEPAMATSVSPLPPLESFGGGVDVPDAQVAERDPVVLEPGQCVFNPATGTVVCSPKPDPAPAPAPAPAEPAPLPGFPPLLPPGFEAPPPGPPLRAPIPIDKSGKLVRRKATPKPKPPSPRHPAHKPVPAPKADKPKPKPKKKKKPVKPKALSGPGPTPGTFDGPGGHYVD